MSENLEEMLRRAQTAEQSAGQTKQEEETQVKQQSEADLEASLKERESLLGEAGKTEQERAKAAELLEKGKELTAGKEKLTAEMEEFMRVAVNSVQEREAQLAALNKQLETIEANPAVIDRLREQAEEENRRIELQKEVSKGFWIKPQGKETGGSMYSALSKSKEYADNVEGRHSGDSALVQLESYAMHASGMMKGEEVVVPLDEAEDVVRRWSEIRQEAESGNPDIQKVDNLLSEFLYARLKHWVDTFDQRVEQTAQRLYDSYQQNPASAKQYKVEGWTVEKWKQDLQRTMPDVRSSLRTAELAMSGKGFKAKTLARLGEDVSNKTRVLGKESYPFFTDNFKEPAKQKER